MGSSTYLRLEAAGTSTVLAATSPADAAASRPALLVFPNPTATLVNIQFDAPARGPAECTIVNVLGAVVYRSLLDAHPGHNVLTADVAALPAGIYTVRIACGSTFQTVKFSKHG